MELSPMPKDITYFLTAKPYLSPRTQQILDLFIFLNLKNRNSFSPVSLMSLISLINDFSRGGAFSKTEPPVPDQTGADIPSGDTPLEESENCNFHGTDEDSRVIVEGEPEGYKALDIEP